MEETNLRGIAASNGIAIGPAFCYLPQELTLPCREPESSEEELSRFTAAVVQARTELEALREQVTRRAGQKEAAIFEAHQMMLDDPMLRRTVRKAIESGRIVEQAVKEAAEELANMLAQMTDELFAARAQDIRDVGRRVLRILLGLPDTALGSMEVPSIVIANDLTPSDTASLDPQLTLGFCTAAGGLTSHSAILARTLGIPAIVALGEELSQAVCTGTQLVLDGLEGKLILHPTAETVTSYRNKQERYQQHLTQVLGSAFQPARTASGRRVEVSANIGDISSAQDAVAYGAEGVGLLRTEFLYLDETQPPSEEKQLRIYREIFAVMGQCPVIVRTLDIGGDKPPAYLPFPEEMNPFLGWRAIRISLDRPEMFIVQLRAILRAAEGYQARIMFPMVSSLDELRQARQIVEQVKAQLEAESLPYAREVPVGIMVETPAAAMLVDVLAEAADFFSLGTNDLTQYTLAVDRGNATVSALYQPLHPSVLRLIKQTIDLAHSRGKWVGMCGELAGMPKAIPILLGMGLDEFSMNPRAIPEAKNLISKLNDDETRHIAQQAITLGTANEIEHLMQGILNTI